MLGFLKVLFLALYYFWFISMIYLFADDSSLFYSAANIKDIEGIINHDLRMLVSWAAQWLINFNPLKTEAMLFTLRLIESLPNLIFDGTRIKFVTEHKHLGLAFSNNGQWHNHIENISLKVLLKLLV